MSMWSARVGGTARMLSYANYGLSVRVPDVPVDARCSGNPAPGFPVLARYLPVRFADRVVGAPHLPAAAPPLVVVRVLVAPAAPAGYRKSSGRIPGTLLHSARAVPAQCADCSCTIPGPFQQCAGAVTAHCWSMPLRRTAVPATLRSVTSALRTCRWRGGTCRELRERCAQDAERGADHCGTGREVRDRRPGDAGRGARLW